MSAKTERLFPFLPATIADALAAVVVFNCDAGAVPKSLPAGTLTFGIVVAGFAATQRNMLLGMRGSTMLRIALRSGYHHDILAYLMHCVYAGLFVSAMSMLGFFLVGISLLWDLWLIALTFAVTLVIVLILRNEILMVRIVKRFMEGEGHHAD